MVVGAGSHFLSGMSHYTVRITNALATEYKTAALPMRRLLPTFLYPGRSRVGRTPTWVVYSEKVTVLSGVDWFWIPSMMRAIRGIMKWKPRFVIFEWWTGTVVHTYLLTAWIARLLGGSIIIEFHEIQDTGEEGIPLAKQWVSIVGRPFFRMASAFVIHSDADRGPLRERYGRSITSLREARLRPS
jgi:hypothetical protein